MEYLYKKTEKANLEISLFARNNVNEIHLFAKNTFPGSFDDQLNNILNALNAYLDENGIPYGAVTFARYFVSDYSNQAEALKSINTRCAGHKTCAVSIVQQPPLDENKIAAWFYIIDDRTGKALDARAVSDTDIRIKRGNYEHFWSTQLMPGNGSVESSHQTTNIFSDYSRTLEKCGYSLKDNLIRTWLFVKDIDFNYYGLVEARKEFFHRHGMTKDTHFVASTGIGGSHADPKISVLMDAYAVGGISQKQIRFLEARENLNPTHEYSVTFERGTSLDYGDRRHIFISGTASIDREGKILYRNDVRKQAGRTIENIAALLASADATLRDVAQMIVYLRDIADARSVIDYFNERYRDIPKAVLLAPVCRPGWLIEIECIAIKAVENPNFGKF
jgi:enamine deaminase RidA (YjgF/YER057c/UK114 family)